jgi:hypothetical protein
MLLQRPPAPGATAPHCSSDSGNNGYGNTGRCNNGNGNASDHNNGNGNGNLFAFLQDRHP